MFDISEYNEGPPSAEGWHVLGAHNEPDTSHS